MGPSDSSDCTENCQILLSETNYSPKKMGDSEELEVNENGLKVFSMEEVEKHTEAKGDSKSIWTVIHDKVYDVTKFLDEHPGGEEIMIENAGHSSDAREMLEEYFIGDVHEDDKTGSKERGAKSWGAGPANIEEESSWSSWLVPMASALIASMMYRYLFVKEE